MKLGNWILDLLFPPKCPFCSAVVDRASVCGACRKSLPWAEPAERTLPGDIRCVSPLFYEDSVRDAILRFKFRGAAGSADAFGELIAECAAEWLSGQFDLVTWVPVSAKRCKERGYDQARLLAEAASSRWDTRPEPLLCKELDNPAQSGLADVADRRSNVLGVYAADRARALGRRVLLVDDIVTTGSTLGECARVLRDAGAETVICVTLAQTRQKTDVGGENTGETVEPSHKKPKTGKNVLAK